MKKIINREYRNLVYQKWEFILQSSIIRNFWLSTKGKVKDIMRASEWWEVIDTYITLCPFYDKKTSWINWEYSSFEEVWIRYRDKFKANIEALNFLRSFINLRVNFVLADRWVLLQEWYEKNNFWNDIKLIKEIYLKEISKYLQEFNFTSFSELWIWIDETCNLGEDKSITEIINILEDFWIEYEKFKYSLQIIIKAFWMTWAYFLVKNYLEENKILLEKFENVIILNTEAVSPLNSLYNSWSFKLDSKNVFARIDINTK